VSEYYGITVCSYCVYKVRVGKQGEWEIIDIDLVREKDILLVSHGICPECADEMRLKLKELKRKK